MLPLRRRRLLCGAGGARLGRPISLGASGAPSAPSLATLPSFCTQAAAAAAHPPVAGRPRGEAHGQGQGGVGAGEQVDWQCANDPLVPRHEYFMNFGSRSVLFSRTRYFTQFNSFFSQHACLDVFVRNCHATFADREIDKPRKPKRSKSVLFPIFPSKRKSHVLPAHRSQTRPTLNLNLRLDVFVDLESEKNSLCCLYHRIHVHISKNMHSHRDTDSSHMHILDIVPMHARIFCEAIYLTHHSVTCLPPPKMRSKTSRVRGRMLGERPRLRSRSDHAQITLDSAKTGEPAGKSKALSSGP